MMINNHFVDVQLLASSLGPTLVPCSDCCQASLDRVRGAKPACLSTSIRLTDQYAYYVHARLLVKPKTVVKAIGKQSSADKFQTTCRPPKIDMRHILQLSTVRMFSSLYISSHTINSASARSDMTGQGSYSGQW